VPTPADGPTVRRRVLGRTGLAVAEIGFGCGPTAGLIAFGEHGAQRAAVERALTLGIDYFDTAPLYGAGESERNLGRLLRELDATPRIATKVALDDTDFTDIRGAILRSVEGSLTRLAQPRITVLHLHNRIGLRRAAKADLGSGALVRVDDVLGPRGVVETFETLRAQGVVEFFGCSAYGGEMSAVEQVVDSGTFDCLQVHYSLLNPSAWEGAKAGGTIRDYRGVAARAAARGLGVIALRVLEAGVLTEHPPATARPGGEASAERRASLVALLEGAPLDEVALRFALSRPEVATVLIGFSDAAQVEAAVSSAAQGALPTPLLSNIDAWRAAAV
jgi:aryl-alcohol dehydrogenase-like predicted oxidoreductase